MTMECQVLGKYTRWTYVINNVTIVAMLMCGMQWYTT